VRKAAQKVTVLDNGAKVVTAATNQAVAAIGLVSNAGSRAENVSGAASVNRSITLSNLGATPGVNIKSVLHRERVGVYGVTLPSNQASVAAALVEAANVREVSQGARDHALAALNGASAQEKIVVDDYLHMAGYQGTALENSPFGTTAGISGSSDSDVLAFRGNAYGAEAVTVVGAGNVDHDALCEAASNLTTGGAVLPDARCRFTGSLMEDRNDYVKDCHFAWGYNVPGFESPQENLGFAVLAELFGNWKKGDQHGQWKMNPLVQWANEGRPGRKISAGGHNNTWNLDLMHQFEGQLISYKDNAMFGFYCVVNNADSGHDHFLWNNRLQGVSNEMQGEIKRWVRGFSAHEVEAAKNAMLVKLETSLSDPVALADNMAVQAANSAVVKDTASVARAAARINAGYLKDLVETYLYDQDFAMAYYGATDGTPDLSQARSRGWDLLPKMPTGVDFGKFAK